MLEVAAEAATVLGTAGAAALFGGDFIRGAGRLACFICNLGFGSGLPGTLPGAAGPLGGSPDDDEEEDENKCAGEERAVMEWKGRVETWEAQVNFYKGEIQKLAAPMNQLVTTLNELAPQAKWEMLRYLGDEALSKLGDLLLGRIPLIGDDISLGDAVGVATGGDPTGVGVSLGTGSDTADAGVGDIVGFGSDMIRYLTLLRDIFTGSFDEIRKIADERRAEGAPMSAIDKFFDAMAQLQKLTDQGFKLSHLVKQKEGELEEHRKELDEAGKALDACRAAVG